MIKRSTEGIEALDEQNKKCALGKSSRRHATRTVHILDIPPPCPPSHRFSPLPPPPFQAPRPSLLSHLHIRPVLVLEEAVQVPRVGEGRKGRRGRRLGVVVEGRVVIMVVGRVVVIGRGVEGGRGRGLHDCVVLLLPSLLLLS